MDRPIVSPEARDRYERLARELVQPGIITMGQMMGMPMLYLGGKGFAGLFGDAMVFKLDGDAHASALALPGATLFDPSGRGRPMKAWVRIPLDQAAAWPWLARTAADALAR